MIRTAVIFFYIANEGLSILESLIKNAEELTDEEIKILLEKATKTKEFKETLRIMREN